MKQLFTILVLLAFFISACAPAATPTAVQAATDVPTQAPALTQDPAQTSQPQSDSALFQIVKADGTRFDVMLGAVKGLALVQITADGKLQEGPKLLDILALAGITDFTEVTITGSSAPCTLTRAQVDNNTLLDFSNRGTMKLATTYIPKAQWTKDITEITVK